jgi:hypothetical protein
LALLENITGSKGGQVWFAIQFSLFDCPLGTIRRRGRSRDRNPWLQLAGVDVLRRQSFALENLARVAYFNLLNGKY